MIWQQSENHGVGMEEGTKDNTKLVSMIVGITTLYWTCGAIQSE